MAYSFQKFEYPLYILINRHITSCFPSLQFIFELFAFINDFHDRGIEGFFYVKYVKHLKRLFFQMEEHDPHDLNRFDPVMVLIEYIRIDNLRLIDLFQFFDTHNRGMLSREDLRDGVAVRYLSKQIRCWCLSHMHKNTFNWSY